MERLALDDLQDWKRRPDRKPLVLRGARQVGKSWLIRDFAKRSFGALVEVNFERDPELAAAFAAPRPRAILQQLELRLNVAVVPGRTMLFLDEIQAAPAALQALRYFHEELPELHVIAAGSLLDAVLGDAALTMPVGRIEYLHLGPMTFEEYLLGTGRERLCRFLQSWHIGNDIPLGVHQDLLADLRRYLVIGGMPECVATWARDQSFGDCERVKHALLATYRDDFAKYRGRVDPDRLRQVLNALPRLIGAKLKYAQVDRDARAKDLAHALRLLTWARLCHPVRHSACDGVPLGAGAAEKRCKVLLLDVGLAATGCGLSALDLQDKDELLLANAGALCEQYVGQQLLASLPTWVDPELHYWVREQRNSAAEVDYVIACGAQPVPVEVKAGKTGTLKSLHLFLREKRRSFGVRVNAEPPTLLQAKTSLPDRQDVPFTAAVVAAVPGRADPPRRDGDAARRCRAPVSVLLRAHSI